MPTHVSGAGSNTAGHAKPTAAVAAKGKFLEAFAKLPDGRFRTTPSGLKVAVIQKGFGRPSSAGMSISVHYTGWLEDGVQFDSSVERGKPFAFRLGGGTVIKGWEEGLAGIKPGERRQLIIPAELAYGERQVGKIPPGATLIFNIEAVSVDSAPGNPKGNVSLRA